MEETTRTQSQPDKVPQQSANKWQQSTKDMWRRSAQVWSDSKDRYHQATVEAWHRSSDSLSNTRNRYEQGTTDAWHRSSNSLSSSRDRYHQSTVGAWQRSTNSWKNSKNRCRQSTADMLNRSAIKLYQSTDRLQKLPYTPTKDLENENQSMQTSKSNTSLPSSLNNRASLPAESSSHIIKSSQQHTSPESPQDSQSSQSLQSPTSSDATQSPHALSETSTESISPKYELIDPSAKDIKQDQQIRELLNMTDNTFFQLHQAKQLRNSKSGRLGEIEHQWITSTINDALRAGQSLVKLLEPHRLDMAKRKGKITSANKKRWKREDCQKAYEKQSDLVLHQERLDRVFAHLKNLDSAKQDDSESEPDPNQPEARSEPMSELEAAQKPLPELTGDVDFTTAPAELSSNSVPEIIPIAELPGDMTLEPAATESTKIITVPKIIITRTPENISVEYLGSPATPDQPHYANENDEMNEILGWKQTRNDVRSHQSTSLSNIISEMDNARINQA